MYLLKITIISLILNLTFVVANANVVANVAASMATQVVNTGAAVYIKKNGMQPEYVTTPYATYVIPTIPSTTPAKVATATPVAPAPVVNKPQVINGNVVQSFPQLAPAATTTTIQ
jgi:hypothetical protein